jgi:TM2 domain-containing membrane protein YozV
MPIIEEPVGYAIPWYNNVPQLQIINDWAIPLFAPIDVDTWALLNLILAAIGIFFAVVAVLRAIKRKREKEEELQDLQERQAFQQLQGFNVFQELNEFQELNGFQERAKFSNAQAIGSQEEEQEQQRRSRLAKPLIAIVLGILGAALFILTQDMTAKMVLADIWTIVHAVIVVAGIAARLIKRKGDRAVRYMGGRSISAEIPATVSI